MRDAEDTGRERSDRLSAAEALEMLTGGETADLLARADTVRRRMHGPKTYFVHSLNLNPTNVCESRCDLCAFWREPEAPDAYRMSLDEAAERIDAAGAWGLTDLHIVGGLTTELPLAYYEDLIALCRRRMPEALVQGMTAVEIEYLARRESLPAAAVLRRLKDAGLGAIPGGGAEIFAPDVRARICKDKIPAETWLAVHAEAHALGIPTNATMLFGHIEGPEDIVDHLRRLRDQQDRTGGFGAFIVLPFHPAGTRLDVPRGPGGHSIARVVAVARLFLDNVPHVRVLANYMDRKLLEVLTHGGADDVGGTSLDERIALAAGAPRDHKVDSIDQMADMLQSIGLQPVLVNSAYQPAGKPRPAGLRPPSPATVSCDLNEAMKRIDTSERLEARHAVALHDGLEFHRLGALAHRRRMQIVPDRTVTYVLDRNISLTNVCESRCRFCAFHVEPGSPEAFTLSIEQVIAKVVQAETAGATQVLVQGGLNPGLDLAFYERMLAEIKRASGLWVHSLSPAEVRYLAQRSGLSIRRTLERLRAAGLDSLPGGGAEILVEDVRREVSPRKITAADWLEVMRTAHQLGMKTTATMVYGLGETTAQRVEHLLAVRDLQDETHGFTAFIPWSFQPGRTDLPRPRSSGIDYLRIVALARLVLDNVPHLQAGWVTEGPDLAQLALSFGADDWGGVLMEEQVVRSTGLQYAVTAEQVTSLIAETGMTPAQRTTQYELLGA